MSELPVLVDGAYKSSEASKILRLAYDRSMRDYALFVTLTYTGRRVNEVVRSLKPSDIDFDNSVIRWRILKQFTDKEHTQHKERVIPASDYVLQTLHAYIMRQKIAPDSFIFPISSIRVWQLTKWYCQQLGIEKKRIVHAFRHGFALRQAIASEGPLDIQPLQELMAHARLDNTMAYFKYSPRRTREMVNRLTPRLSRLRKSNLEEDSPGKVEDGSQPDYEQRKG